MKKNFTVHTTEDVPGLGMVGGFKVAGAACDIRNKNDLKRLDVALIVSETPATGAGVFTTNDVKAAPVLTDMAHLSRSEKIKAIVANSGNANACNGERGMTDAMAMCKEVAKYVGSKPEQVLVCSTGRIGEFLPMQKIEKGVKDAFEKLSDSEEQSRNAAAAILTSDTRPKTVLVKVEFAGKTITLAGMGKGAGMIEPNMATMLAFIACDASISQKLLKECLRFAANKTFNRITIDGDMSTNDTVLCLCNGSSGVDVDESDAAAIEAFKAGLLEVCRILARKMVSDGEKITKVIEVKVTGARDEEQAEKICRAIGNSLLVKSSWFGGDPNWGRLADAAGYARTGLDFSKFDLFYNDTAVLKGGEQVVENKDEWRRIVANKTFTITINLNQGSAEEVILSTDLTDGYVNFNKGE